MDDQTAEQNDRLNSSHLNAGDAPPPKKKKGALRWIVRIIVVLIILLIAFAVLRPNKHNFQHRPGAPTNNAGGMADNSNVTPVAVTTVRRGDMPIVLQTTGTVVPITNVTITPRVTGHILDVYYQEGQFVHKGDELELIDPRPYEAALGQARGTLAADTAQLERARVDNARYQKLIRQNSTSAMTARDQEFTVQQLEGTVALDQANVRTAELNVMYCHITAPVDGRVGIRVLDKGNYVSAGQSGGLTILTQMQPISVILAVPQRSLGHVAERLHSAGQLTVEAWDSDNLRNIATGTVKALDSQIDTATGVVRMRAIFDNQDERLFPNQFVNPHLLIDTQHDVLLVPDNAIQTGPNGQFVYVVQPDMTVSETPVQIGAADINQTVILSGVKEGDRVVTDGVNHLRPGAKVSIPADTAHTKAGAEAGSTAGTSAHTHRHN
ncbi:multidrug efflux pump acriflavin resistance protein AcrB/AcrD/AcrF [Neokomagataea thailandica NBRC 106555]|uniref:Efflux RND transporter periplasmic adaptor subunit n=2 Tax=Neokomagataea TaxID=1223423 RepID=A0A4Y6V6H6_9PROT|nr:MULTISPECIES: efflux RND transporter periplasmic adaptor subunit [Neokomagataea]QDH24176.1 efflux RND transporter periplasmic adaptor subunit [Neokomagataea tanensis]GBR50631.1 multidrug efflux pump acriflavin resistance protein AcrB/AcrD/AcrF [Neokomagataea thailandica NBRC 106555]